MTHPPTHSPTEMFHRCRRSLHTPVLVGRSAGVLPLAGLLPRKATSGGRQQGHPDRPGGRGCPGNRGDRVHCGWEEGGTGWVLRCSFISPWLKTSVGLTGYIGCSSSESSVIRMIIHIGLFGGYTAAKLPNSKRVCLSACLFVCLSVL